MVIGIDIDGVLFPWEDAVAAAIMAKFGLDLGPMTSWNAYAERAPEAWDWLWTPEGSDAVLSQTWRTYPGVIEAVRGIIKAGHAVHFVTHRDPCQAGWNTARFLSRHFHGLRWHGLHVLRNDVPKRKLHRWDAFVDDKPETVFDFLDNTNAVVFSPRRLWNEAELGDHVVDGFVHYTDPAVILEWATRYA